MNDLICQPSTHKEGLVCVQHIFQRMMDQILDKCEGVIGIADDIIIHGKDDEEHDRRLHKFTRVAREQGLVLNKSKCEVNNDSIKLFGCTYDKYLTHQDPSKVSAIKEMPFRPKESFRASLEW